MKKLSELERLPADGVARLFPLPDVVLFPHGLLPLHIFEPRYRQMTQDALGSDRLIAMAIPLGVETSAPPPLFTVGCVGMIQQEERLPDGRFTFLLRGLSRVRIDEEVDGGKMYRQAKVSLLNDHADPRWVARRRLQRADIVQSMRRFLSGDDVSTSEFLNFLSTRCTSAVFSDVVSYAAPIPPTIKHRLLALENVDERLEILSESLRDAADETGAEPRLEWPREFSAN